MGAGAFLRAQANERVEYKEFKKETPIAVVYHLDFGDPNRFGQMLTNIGNHLSVYDNPSCYPAIFWVRRLMLWARTKVRTLMTKPSWVTAWMRLGKR
ncbi:hypothetical protein SAMN04488243_105104 [Thermus arciformis]|uniref:Uncharacterized protein n=1 Tax=Thermus arciformis TaxID=482827 RepID=A0A1G7EI62_9DEIN|nr:hypothetical protein SAMN04488243_105104 [Thermus arciformis]